MKFVLLIPFLMLSCGNEITRRADAVSGSTKTPLGVTVKKELGPPTALELYTIDKALTNKFRDARCSYIGEHLEHKEYKVAILKADEIRNGLPVLKWYTDKFIGTSYDKEDEKGHFTYIGGLYNGSEILVPEHTNMTNFAEAVANEVEHQILENQPDVHAHPLIKPCVGGSS